MRVLLSLLGAAVISLGVGLAASKILSAMPCQGEGLVCNINDAAGAYAAMIWAGLGPLVFGVILLLARHRVSLASGAVLLLAPLLVFVALTEIEALQSIGFEPYKTFRQVMTVLVPPLLTIATQWLLLRYLLGPGKAVPQAVATPEADPKPEAKPEPDYRGPIRGGGGFEGFPTE